MWFVYPSEFLSFFVLKVASSQAKTQVCNDSSSIVVAHEPDRQRLLWNKNGYDMGVPPKVIWSFSDNSIN